MGGPWDNVSYLQFLSGLHKANTTATNVNMTSMINGSDVIDGFGAMGTDGEVGSIRPV